MSGYPAGGWLPQELDLDAMDGWAWDCPTCDACGEPATEVVPDGTKSGLPMCADCAERETKSEEESNGS